MSFSPLTRRTFDCTRTRPASPHNVLGRDMNRIPPSPCLLKGDLFSDGDALYALHLPRRHKHGVAQDLERRSRVRGRLIRPWAFRTDSPGRLRPFRVHSSGSVPHVALQALLQLSHSDLGSASTCNLRPGHCECSTVYGEPLG